MFLRLLTDSFKLIFWARTFLWKSKFPHNGLFDISSLMSNENFKFNKSKMEIPTSSMQNLLLSLVSLVSLSPFSSSGLKHWSYPWFLKLIQLTLPLKYVYNLNTYHLYHCYHLSMTTMISLLSLCNNFLCVLTLPQ